MLREVLTSPREWFVGLSYDSVQQIRTCLEQYIKTWNAIDYFDSGSSAEEHKEILEQTYSFCDETQRQLIQILTYLKSKKAEQLETQIDATVAEAEQRFNTAVDLSEKQREKAEQNESQRQQEFSELKNKLNDELAKESVSKHRAIFAKQAGEHRHASRRWLIATGGLIIVFGAVFYWLFESLKLGGTELIGVLQNVFTKGFLLTLIYFILNRSSKNYTAQKHLEVVNRHRQNALDTFDDFLEASGDNRETRDAVLLAATNAIFDTNQSGYLSAKMKGSESTNPFQQVFKAVMPDSSKKSD